MAKKTSEVVLCGSPYFFKSGDKNFVVDKLRQFLYSRWYLTTIPKYKVCSNVFDSSMTAMVSEYRQYHRLRPQGSTGNMNMLVFGRSLLNESTYEQIGSEMTAVEIDAMSAYDVEVKNLLYGISTLDLCNTWIAIAPVIAKDKFIGWGGTRGSMKTASIIAKNNWMSSAKA